MEKVHREKESKYDFTSNRKRCIRLGDRMLNLVDNLHPSDQNRILRHIRKKIEFRIKCNKDYIEDTRKHQE